MKSGKHKNHQLEHIESNLPNLMDVDKHDDKEELDISDIVKESFYKDKSINRSKDEENHTREILDSLEYSKKCLLKEKQLHF